jgi:uncharacterized membrane protein YfcA
MIAFVVGCFIAMVIGITGAGAGTITAPILIAVFHEHIPAAVGTALAFGAVTKLVLGPAYAMRRQISMRVLLLMLAGGIPGVVVGSLALRHLELAGHQAEIGIFVGSIVVISATVGIVRLRRERNRSGRLKVPLLCISAFAIAVEVGFSSAGSGTLAAIALMSFTALSTATIVGTDLALSLAGGGLLISSGTYDHALLIPLAAGGVFGAILAPMIAPKFSSGTLRKVLLAASFALGAQLLVKGAFGS